MLLDLLRVQSADAAEQLLKDRDFLKDFVAGNVFVRDEDKHDKYPITTAQVNRIETAVRRALPRTSDDYHRTVIENIVRVVDAAKERLYGVTAGEAGWHASLDRHPPVMTLQEFDALFARWQTEPSASHATRLVTEHAAIVDQADSVVLDASLANAVRRRGAAIDEAADAVDLDDAARAIQHVDRLLELIGQLVNDLDALSDRTPNRVDRFLSIRSQTNQFANRLDDQTYASNRARQREFLYTCARRLHDRAADVLKELRPWDDHPPIPHMVGAEEITETRTRLHSFFAQVVAEDVVARFRRRGAIASIGNFGAHPSEIWVMLLDREVHFTKCRVARS